MLALAYIDLEPQSSDSLANSENLPYVAWRSISHEDRDGRLTADCFCQGTQNSSIMRKIKTCPPYILDKHITGIGNLCPTPRKTTVAQTRGKGRSILPAALKTNVLQYLFILLTLVL